MLSFFGSWTKLEADSKPRPWNDMWVEQGGFIEFPDLVGTNPAVFNRENTGRLEGEKIGNNFYEVSIKCQCHVHLICCCEYVELHVRSELEMWRFCLFCPLQRWMEYLLWFQRSLPVLLKGWDTFILLPMSVIRLFMENDHIALTQIISFWDLFFCMV